MTPFNNGYTISIFALQGNYPGLSQPLMQIIIVGHSNIAFNTLDPSQTVDSY